MKKPQVNPHTRKWKALKNSGTHIEIQEKEEACR